ncbi:glycogen debranching enzyme N-terminal domain-containing protein [Mangrovibacterium marinum]|uniref:Putative glycogen debranching enzyme n=1 Tax=Mangrovibacterium marinum TaxID=1639118 RepID=A0A2T5BYJ7_9BACT|nr:amylo-alpha-1,6-glucosidase [Mangrovibacterium marinum]PTN07300.1 putative glycogen debranching enzyme [Mangrovibacterium marinum]
MSYLKFDKTKLVNLEYSLNREVIRSNRSGSYMSTTIAGCNTRKYHGILISPIEGLAGDKHLLLASLDETVIQHGAEFNLGIHKYEGDHYEPKGHKYIRDFDAEYVPKTTWRVGGVVLTKERLLVENEEQALIRYTLVEANSPTTLRLKPFLAFRSIHELSKANMYADTKYIPVDKGIKMKLYEGYPFLNMQLSKQADFVPVPHWYNRIEYQKERERGFDCQEDLYVPGYFEFAIKKGESIIFSASTNAVKPGSLKAKFTKESSKRVPRTSFLNCLKNSAQQFIVRDKNEVDIIAGFPWYTGVTRQTFVALPGLTLSFDDPETFEQVIDTQLKGLKNGLFPKFTGRPEDGSASLDVSLWFFWAVQQLCRYKKCGSSIWLKYGQQMTDILNAYKNGTDYGIRMYPNGLVGSDRTDLPLSWMDSVVDGEPVVKRLSMPVEVNALWYNAVCFALELAEVAHDSTFIEQWAPMPALIAKSFTEAFWSDEEAYLADSVNSTDKDWTVRPNMVIAAAMEYSPLDREKQKCVLSVAKQQLLTPRGLRSLSPESPDYEGIVTGSVVQRNRVIYQGAAWPWLVQFFAEAYLNVHKRGGIHVLKRMLEDFEGDMTEHCIGSISEMYNGNPPHLAKGAVSQAWSVASVTRSIGLLVDFNA